MLHSATCRARKAQPVSNERPDAVAAGCSGGRRMAAGPDAPLAARHFDALVRRGAEASVPREGRRQKKSVVRPIPGTVCYLGVSGGAVTETLFVRYCQATIKLKRKFALLFWVTYVKPESQQSFTLFEPELSSSCVACTT